MKTETYQWSRIDNLEINLSIYSQLIFEKGAKNTQWRKDRLFNKWCWENWISTCKRMKLDPYLTPHLKISSKWIKHLNVKPETVELLEENIGVNFCVLRFVSSFLDMIPKAQATKEKNK